MWLCFSLCAQFAVKPNTNSESQFRVALNVRPLVWELNLNAELVCVLLTFTYKNCITLLFLTSFAFFLLLPNAKSKLNLIQFMQQKRSGLMSAICYYPLCFDHFSSLMFVLIDSHSSALMFRLCLITHLQNCRNYN